MSRNPARTTRTSERTKGMTEKMCPTRALYEIWQPVALALCKIWLRRLRCRTSAVIFPSLMRTSAPVSPRMKRFASADKSAAPFAAHIQVANWMGMFHLGCREVRTSAACKTERRSELNGRRWEAHMTARNLARCEMLECAPPAMWRATCSM